MNVSLQAVIEALENVGKCVAAVESVIEGIRNQFKPHDVIVAELDQAHAALKDAHQVLADTVSAHAVNDSAPTDDISTVPPTVQ